MRPLLGICLLAMLPFTASAEEPAPHPTLDGVRARQPSFPRGVEHPVRVPGVHALQVEAVAVVEANRERVVAQLSVERVVEAASDALSGAA